VERWIYPLYGYGGVQAGKKRGVYSQKLLAEKSAQKKARVLAKVGQNLGGSDIDNWLVDYFATTQGLVATPDYPPGRAVENSAILQEQARNTSTMRRLRAMNCN